jgi:predicted amidohydrolase
MKCCLAQIASCWDDPDGTLKKVEPLIKESARLGASLIAFPEQFATGWDPQSISHSEDLNGSIVSTLCAFAEEYGIAVLGSFRERTSSRPRNTAVAIGPDGEILTIYAKIHPFSLTKEDEYYQAGETLGLFTLDMVSFGIAICYDLRFPDLFRIYAGKDIHCVLVPAAWPASRSTHWEILIKARALDNQIFVVGINTTGSTPVETFSGGSMVVDPQGKVILHAGMMEGIFLFDVDAHIVTLERGRSRVIRDWRGDLYRHF